ncbi:MAG: rRNA pseudouridine synthase [Gemmatimonadales bacterium]|nr:rRNA pseudouridine synthase [Gemmatimonadales bacterium]MYG49628.1 rRNA pseudouridine synthase [Gemmatimonadales bacterium]MYK01502.1 rRNA pseudouridine synthase [Candidatus Palauibacter ramosifaciens]
MRLQKYLARAGVASRRASEALIAAGRVRVNGEVVTKLGVTVDPDAERVDVDGRRVRLKPLLWLALNKPPGYACTRHDPRRRPIIYDLLPADVRHLPHVGRLDFMSEGLLLLSNEGDVVHRLLHPGTGIERVYHASLRGPVAAELPDRLQAGVALEDGPARARRAGWITPPHASTPTVEIVLAEGRNREIRRMLASLGVTLRRLRRTSFGPVRLGALAAGAARELSPKERAALRRAAGPACSRAVTE